MHNELILHFLCGKLFCGCVSAVEAHKRICEGIVESALYLFVVEVGRDSVVDVEKSYNIVRNALTYELAHCAVDVNLAGAGDTLCGKAAVDIARHKAELRLECRPALVCEYDIFSRTLVSFCPVEESYLKLRKLRQNSGHLVACAKLAFHFLYNTVNACIACVFVESGKKVKLGVFFDLNAEVIKSCDRRIAGKEVLRARTECDNFKARKSEYGSCNGNKVGDHIRNFIRISNGILGYVSPDIAKSEVVACVEHTAESIASAVNEVIAEFFRCRCEHNGQTELLCKESFSRFGSEVSEVDNKRINACFSEVVKGAEHIVFILNSYGTFVNVDILLFASLDNAASS